MYDTVSVKENHSVMHQQYCPNPNTVKRSEFLHIEIVLMLNIKNMFNSRAVLKTYRFAVCNPGRPLCHQIKER